jgi:hypothetical protein
MRKLQNTKKQSIFLSDANLPELEPPAASSVLAQKCWPGVA